jgi:hypothetical protein
VYVYCVWCVVHIGYTIHNTHKKSEYQFVDLARLLRQYKQSDYVVVKMDIEGAEFELLVHLIKENVLGLIDTIAIEYHKYMSPYKSEYALFSKIFKKYKIDEKNWL